MKLNQQMKCLFLTALLITQTQFPVLAHTPEPLPPINTTLPVSTPTTQSNLFPKILSIKASSYTMKVDNKTIQLTDEKSPHGLPAVFREVLMVPIKPLAETFKGKYSYDAKTKKATLTIDGSSFEFVMGSSQALVNGKAITLPLAARIDGNFVRVPAAAFKGNLKDYDVIVFNNFNFIIIQKGGPDFYDAEGKPIGEILPDTGDWKAILSNNSKAKEAAAKADEIVNQISRSGMSDYEKVIAVNDYLVSHTTYTLKDAGLYDPILKGKGLCQGYAYSAQLLLSKMGVETICIGGYADISSAEYSNNFLDAVGFFNNLHKWNMVKVDGNWYHLDVTFNDGTINGVETGDNARSYFLLSDAAMSKNHTWRKAFFPKAPKSFLSTTSADDNASAQPIENSGTNNVPAADTQPSVNTSYQPTLINIDAALLSELQKALSDYNAANHKVLSKLTNADSVKTLEKTAPKETSGSPDGDYTLYFPRPAIKGVSLFSSYSISSSAKSVRYSITLNNMNITSDNCKSIMDSFNNYLQKSLNIKIASEIRVFLADDHKFIKLNQISNQQLYNQLIDGKAQLNITYKIDKVTYTALLIGNPQSGLASVMLSADIKN